MTTTQFSVNSLSPKGIKLYRIAGWSLLGICLLHLVFWCFITRESWPGWVSGRLWDLKDESLEATTMHFHFWALPGSFMVPLLLLSLLIIRAARQGDKLPAYVGWTLLAWVLVCSLVLMPSGFLLGIIPCVLLVWAGRCKN